MCDFGAPIQTMLHIVNGCPIAKYVMGLEYIHQVTITARDYWINNVNIEISFFLLYTFLYLNILTFNKFCKTIRNVCTVTWNEGMKSNLKQEKSKLSHMNV